MFAVVRTGGKQYRVAPGDKIVVEKLDGEAGQRIDITDVLLAGDGSDLKSVEGLVVGAEIIAQAKSDKVTVFKKRRRHNYRRKQGHRQQLTILRIVSIGDQKAEDEKKPAKAAKPVPSNAEGAPKPEASAEAAPAAEARGQTDVGATENPAPETAAKPNKPAKPASSKAKAAESGSTNEAAPAKGAAKKAPKAK